MRDANQQYPLHQSGGNGRHHPFDDDTGDGFNDEGGHHKPVQPGPLHQRETLFSPQLPRGRFNKALIIGAIAGTLAALQGIIFTLANASLYHTVSTIPQDKLTLSLAEAVFGLVSECALNWFKWRIDRPGWGPYNITDFSCYIGSYRRAYEPHWSLACDTQASLLLSKIDYLQLNTGIARFIYNLSYMSSPLKKIFIPHKCPYTLQAEWQTVSSTSGR